MSIRKAKMFNRTASKPKNKADKILETLALRPGQKIADIGSGGGYFTIKFAQAVGEKGKVYAVDTNQEFLEYITKHATEQGLTNIIILYTTSEYLDLPEHSFDWIFLRNVTHHLPHRIEYFEHVREALKQEGKLAIIEYDGRGGFFSFQKLHRHFIPTEILIEDMKQAGYKIQMSYTFLSEQSFIIFTKK